MKLILALFITVTRTSTGTLFSFSSAFSLKNSFQRDFRRTKTVPVLNRCSSWKISHNRQHQQPYKENDGGLGMCDVPTSATLAIVAVTANTTDNGMGKKPIIIERLNDENRYRTTSTIKESGGNGRKYDLTSPREWMEYSPTGAYTVLRCEYNKINYIGTWTDTNQTSSDDINDGSNKNYDNIKGWKIWGIDYHIQRLIDSFYTSDKTRDRKAIRHSDEIFEAKDDTIRIMQTLLDDTESSSLCLSSTAGTVGKQNKDNKVNYDFATSSQSTRLSTQVFMLTILWYPVRVGNRDVIEPSSSTLSSSIIQVKGHICRQKVVSSSLSSMQNELSSPQTYPPLVVTAIATPSTYFPNRVSPEAKMSLWCTIRRPIEDAFKGHNGTFVDEVILTTDTLRHGDRDDSNADGIILLEGLTTNLFCVYKPDNVIRTTVNNGKVLNGFAQHIVLDAANQLGYTIDTETPIRLQDFHLWNEVFLTSSIKLITGVKKMYVPIDVISLSNSNTSTGKATATVTGLRMLWKYNRTATSMDQSVQQHLYHFLLKYL